MRFFLIYILLITASSSLGAAPRTCRVLFLGGTPDAPRSVQLFDGTTAQEIELPRMNFSPVYKLAEGDIALRLLEKAPERPEDIPATAPNASLRESITDFYLLISSDPENKTVPLSMQIIDAKAYGFGKGQLLWFNLTPNRITGKIGSQQLVLEPNSRSILKAPARTNEDYPVDIYYQLPGKKEIWPLCETKWLHNPASRIVLVIVQEQGSRAPRIMGFIDFREEKKKE